MSEQVSIQSVSWRCRKPAIRFIAAGDRRDEISEVRAEALRQLVEGRGARNSRIWWARREGRCCAAAMVLSNPGRTGMLLHAPMAAPGVDSACLVAVTRGVCRAALDGGLSLVQEITEQSDHRDREFLRQVGMQPLARLLYLRCELTGMEIRAGDNAFTWRRYGEFDDRQLGELIVRTYEGSADCPILAGVRKSEDIIAGHKACGRFHPDSWWIADRDGRPAGCVLVNDTGEDTSEIVYLGAAREHRGCGLGAAMVARALQAAVHRGRRAVDVVVDDENRYAGQVYGAAGFVCRAAREAYVMLHKS